MVGVSDIPLRNTSRIERVYGKEYIAKAKLVKEKTNWKEERIRRPNCVCVPPLAIADRFLRE